MKAPRNMSVEELEVLLARYRAERSWLTDRLKVLGLELRMREGDDDE